ncbi:MAG TPA: hypothetical protein VGF79_13160 [Bacteroidia bacterium]
MKKLLIILAILPHFLIANEIEQKHTISLGIGAPNMTVSLFNIFNNYNNNFSAKGTGPFHLKYENRIHPHMSIGLNINSASYDIRYVDNVLDTNKGTIVPNNVRIKGRNTAFNIRYNVHFLKPENFPKFDCYFGLGLGMRFGKPVLSSEYSYYTPSLKLPNFSVIGLESTLGMRYFFTDHIGVYTEIGLAKSIVQLGLSGRF